MVNGVIAYVLAFLLTTIIHEMGHWIAGIISGTNPRIHHNYVEHLNYNISNNSKSFIALAGPFLSLLQGFYGSWRYSVRDKDTRYSLFLIWFSVLGFNNVLGYFMMGPLFQVGDIGKFYQLNDVPIYVQIILCVIAAVGLLFVANRMTKPFLRFCYDAELLITPKTRKRFSFTILMLPWMIGSVIVTLLNLPIIARVSIIYPVMSGFVFIYPWQNSATVTNIMPTRNKAITRFWVGGFILLLLLVFVFKFVLPVGIGW